MKIKLLHHKIIKLSHVFAAYFFARLDLVALLLSKLDKTAYNILELLLYSMSQVLTVLHSTICLSISLSVHWSYFATVGPILPIYSPTRPSDHPTVRHCETEAVIRIKYKSV